MVKNNNQTYFTIIVPIYNSDKWVDNCINSVFHQTYNNFELVLVNDGSTDKSLDICQQYSNNHKNIKIFSTKHLGANHARLHGLKNSNGKYIIFIDSDDQITNNCLDELHKITQRHHPELVLFNLIINEKDKKILWNNNTNSNYNSISGYFDKERINKILYPEIFDIGRNFIAAWSCCFKKELLEKSFCKNLNIVYGEDFCTLYPSIYNAGSIYFLDKYLYCYNKINNSNFSREKLYTFSNILILYEYLFNEFVSANKQIKMQIEKSFIYAIWVWCDTNIKYGKKCFILKLDKINNKEYQQLNGINSNSLFSISEKLLLMFLKRKNFQKIYWLIKTNKFIYNLSH